MLTFAVRLAEAAFWVSAGLIVYTYLLFPALLVLRARLFRKPFRTGDDRPRVSVLVAAYNEAAMIVDRIRNLRELDYPRDRVEIVVASDGSTDGTDDAVRAAADEDDGIRLLSLPRGGKGAALNAAAEAATGELLVFTDANTVFAPGALAGLVRPFADPDVGGAAGDQVYLRGDAPSATADGERAYWNFDRRMKAAQGRAGSVTSATGAIYAIRRPLFRPIPAGTMDDFMVSTGVVAQGRRLVFVPEAVAFEPVATGRGVEYSRKVRIIAQGLRAVLARRELLNPFRHGFYALQLFSHKVLRRLVAVPLVGLLVASPLLWSQGLAYQAATAAQAAFYGWAAVGWLLRGTPLGRKKAFTLPYFFCLVNVAALAAVVKILRGQSLLRWEPERHAAGPDCARPAAVAATAQGS